MPARSTYVIIALLLAVCPFGVTATDADWVAPDPGLLRDADFDAVQRGERRAWGMAQHAGQKSYQFHFEPGLLRIERVGPEPWGQVRQRIRAEALVGKTLEFSAELSGNLSESEEHPSISATGLGARAFGYRAGMPPFVGKAILLTAEGESAMPPGEQVWTRRSVRFEVPEGASDVEVSIRLTMHGTLFVRGPSLVVVEAVSAGGLESP